jgi:hypothetical protein
VDLYSVRGTPLHAAALYKQECTMKILLEHHADVRHQFLCSLFGCVQKKTLKWKILWSVALVLHLYILFETIMHLKFCSLWSTCA